MPVPSRLVLLPAAFVASATPLLAAGIVVIVDLTADDAAVPDGAWVRVRRAEGAPGTGALIVMDGPPHPTRPTWLERTGAGEPAPGFAGLYLRGLGSGGHAGAEDVRALSAAHAGLGPLLVDWPHPPDVLAPRTAGLVLGDVLAGHFPLGPNLGARLARLTAGDFRRVAHQNFVASLASPAYRRVVAGERVEDVARGLYEADDAFVAAWPAGAGLLHAPSVARRFPTLVSAVLAWGLPDPQIAVTTPIPAPTPEPDGLGSIQPHEPIAVIGLGCRLPRSASATQLWDNLVAGFSGIVEVPKTRWDPALYWDPDKSAIDKTYAKIGGFVTDFTFNPKRFRIPPSVSRLVDPIQQMALEAAADALDDAGYGETRQYDRSRVATILGNSMGGEITDEYTLRVMFPAMRKALNDVPGFAALRADDRAAILVAYEQEVKRDLPPITEDSMPGELANVVAGRITNALNLGGPNFTTDAACAGSMAAIQAAVKGLQDGDFDMALTGGADRSMGVATYAKFCKIGALSPDGSRPFDAGANGFVMGEGVGILVLKRLSDALRDGDRVYAVVRGFGASSDGKGKGITAPNPDGQRRALRRAYENAGVDPADVDIFECHGTSTVVGDKVEVEALADLIGPGRRTRATRIGSIKSNIGHLKSAAGAASALKMSLALFHGVLPASINYRSPRPDVDYSVVPLQVQTATEAWEHGGPRYAGISAFGFGGTNFHMVLEGFRAGMAKASATTVAVSAWPPVTTSVGHGPSGAPRVVAPASSSSPPPVAGAPNRTVAAIPVPTGLWALSADSPEELVERCAALVERGEAAPYEADAPLRVAAHAVDRDEQLGQVEKVVSAVRKGKGYDLLRQRGIALEDVPCDGEIAFLFTGQGSQYLGMGLDLCERYPIVAATFREADAVMEPLLGQPLTALIRRDEAMSEEDQFERLRDTAISQPATLAVDVALLRLLSAYGVRPDMVAGHSLGEYGALVAAGILSFKDALVAVSARGREMASVKLDDVGKMSGIAASTDVVMEVLAEVPGYVVPANKNSPSQTVIAGETDAVEAAGELFKSRGITVYPLPVSHAFHSRIVAPASAPLKRVLEGLDIREPVRRITTNVDSRYYPTGEGARAAIIENLAAQVAAPVEWIAQVERMYADGARIFVECGPKRALSGFVVQILKHRPHRALYTNQPKRGGVSSFLDTLAELFVLGFPVTPLPAATTDIFAPNDARRSTTPLLAARAPAPPAGTSFERVGTPEMARIILEIVSRRTGLGVEDLDLDHDIEADLGIDTVKTADIMATVRETLRLEADPNFKMGQHRTLRQLVDYAARSAGATQPSTMRERRPATEAAPVVAAGGPVRAATPGAPMLPADSAARFLAQIAGQDPRGVDPATFATAMLPALQGFLGAAWTAFQSAQTPVAVAPLAAPVPSPTRPLGPTPTAPTRAPIAEPLRIVCSGASLGLPGGAEVFEPDGIQRILKGENRIGQVSEADQDRILAKHVVRLTKDPVTGEGGFLDVERREQVIRLAGRKSHFDLVTDYGVEASFARSLDITTQLAIAAAVEALRDAGIPLVRTWRKTTTGKDVATGWALPDAMRDTTGLIFASAFAGYDQLVRKLKNNGGDGEGHFDRRFLFQILAMGHSQLAQFLGARGPNTAINAACASTTQGLAIAEDWIRMGRCERVIVVGSDDVTSDDLLEWIGTGFLAAGAATTTAEVELAALPFDRRRHGMILGMGAAALVLERAPDVAARGMAPVAELLGTHIANSAFHGTRLDASHIAREVKTFADKVVAAAGVSHERFAESCVFLSHETYTPARGGSAAAEMASLPHAFGASASKMVIANTKGYTGHPMGAGIEDTVAVKALQYQLVPPIPNLKEPDPDLGQLTLSTGGHYDVTYALRLAAGFGSQLALAAWKKGADGDARIVNAEAHAAWLRLVGGAPGKLVVEARQLRLVVDPAANPGVGSTASAPGLPKEPPSSTPTGKAVLDRLVAVVAAKTGYGIDEIDPSYELEADLGIDTVKQAEIFAEVREAYALDRDDSFKLADYSTVEKLAGWLTEQVARKGGSAVPDNAPTPTTAAIAPVAAAADAAAVLARLISVVAAKTGYDTAEIDPDYELEADLGIDTVKQAEIFAEVRDAYALERDDSFKLADYPTVGKLAGWMAERVAAKAATSVVAPVAVAQPGIPAGLAPAPAAATPEPRVADPATERAPGDLPPDFRVRRVVRVSQVKLPVSTLRGQVVRVLGSGSLATALRDEIDQAGARSQGDPDVVIDCGIPLLELFAQAQQLDGKRPRQWVAAIVPAPDLRGTRDNGARAGLCKALGREWPSCRARVVSLRAGWGEIDAARALVDELDEADRATEVWVGPGERDVAALAVEAVPTHGQWPEHPVAILTGGTRGITAQVGLELARRGPCTLILVARTAPAAEPLDEDAARTQIRSALSTGSKRVTPRMIEDRLKPLRVAEEARQTVQAMRALGAEVTVATVDMADGDAVRALVARLREAHPRLDLVIHGAGAEESRLLPDKDEAAFRRVYDGKAEGGLALVEALDRQSFFVSMGSIAGRFGNAGQVDYSAANEAMAQVCLSRPRSLHIAWTAWADVGMAVRGGMETLLTSRGVELLPPLAGARVLCDLIAAGVSGELVIAGGLGDFQSPAIHPLLDSVELIGDRAIARRALSLGSDPWMADHAIDNIPVLPGVIGLEMMVGTALAAHPRGRYAGAEDVTFSAPLKLHRDEPVHIEITAAPDDEGTWTCALRSTRTLKNGRQQTTNHFEARIQLAEMPPLPSLPSAYFPAERISQKEIYRRYFHGPRFQVLRGADAVAIQGLLAEAVVEHGPIGEGLLTEPLVLEAAFQAAGLHRMAIDGLMALPASIDAVELARSAVEGETLQVVVHARGGTYDIDVDGAYGRVLRVRGFRMVEKGPLDPSDRLPAPEGGWPSAALAVSGEAEAELPPSETASLTARGTPKRQADRLAGQLAANRAVAGLVPAGFSVGREPSGKPVVVGTKDVTVSITHTDGEALALAVRGAHAGVDMEAIEPRSDAFAAEWFTDAERAWAHTPEARTAVWSVKEAVLKALGTGMALSPREIDVHRIDAGRAQVTLVGDVAARHAALGGAPIRVRVSARGGRIVATAIFAA
ncbi:MAG: SDR family NAD(P)-dependent oxidoreductase [Myxococcales bacterium]|nr:SDR family NAD(P)-dependent oxidoreductase [Myxococcales bacterium]